MRRRRRARICRRGSAPTSGMLDYFQGSAAIWVPDNLKSGVTTANRYEPEINRTYAELARHYGAVVIPARVATPDRQTQSRGQCPDRAAVGPGGVAAPHLLHARRSERRHRRAVDAINDAPMKGTGVSRRALFEQLDRPALKPLPRTRYELADMAAVSREHRLSRGGGSQLLQRAVSARARAGRGARHGAATVEVFFNGRRVASHVRASPAAAAFRRRSSTCRGPIGRTPNGRRPG